MKVCNVINTTLNGTYRHHHHHHPCWPAPLTCQHETLPTASTVSGSEPYQLPWSVSGCRISDHSVQSWAMWYEDVLVDVVVFSKPPEGAQRVSRTPCCGCRSEFNAVTSFRFIHVFSRFAFTVFWLVFLLVPWLSYNESRTLQHD